MANSAMYRLIAKQNGANCIPVATLRISVHKIVLPIVIVSVCVSMYKIVLKAPGYTCLVLQWWPCEPIWWDRI